MTPNPSVLLLLTTLLDTHVSLSKYHYLSNNKLFKCRFINNELCCTYLRLYVFVYLIIFSIISTYVILKGSYGVAKKNIILCIWCNAMCLWFKDQKTHYFPHTVHYCCSSMLSLSETRWFLQSSSFWEARRALIGQLSGALWLAEYLKRETEMLRPSPYYDAVSRRNETKTIKPIINTWVEILKTTQ